MRILLDCLTAVSLFLLVLVTAVCYSLYCPISTSYLGDRIELGGGYVSAWSSPELTLDFTSASRTDCELVQPQPGREQLLQSV